MQIDIEFNSGAQLLMDAIPELARSAEAYGFGCVWGGEANNKDPTVMLSAVAAVTNRMKIGSAVYHILGRTPATLALQAVGLDELSRGRFLLGIGVSNPTIAKWHGVAMDHPMSRLQEYLQIVRRGMRGEKLDFDGRYFTSHGFNMANPAEIRRIADAVRQGAREARKDPAAMEIICKIRCSIAHTYDAAREALSHALTYYALADYYRHLLGRMGFATEVEAMRSAWKSGGFHAARKLITDRLFDGLPLVAATSAEEVVEQIAPYRAAGATRIILPYVAASEDVVGEMRSFINYWTP